MKVIFATPEEKQQEFQKELKALLLKYNAELVIERFDKRLTSNDLIVVEFGWDENLSNIGDTGCIPDWVIGRYEDGRG